MTEIGVSEIDESFQDLWIEKVNAGSRLLVERSPATLRWHFEIPGDRGSTRVLCCSENGELRGYAVIRNDIPDETSGLRKSIIADMLVKKTLQFFAALLVAAYSHAKQAGTTFLRCWVFRNPCGTFASNGVRTRENMCVPFTTKRRTRCCIYTLEGGAWYASPFDGDTALTVRQPAASGAQPDPGDDVVSGVPREDRAMVY